MAVDDNGDSAESADLALVDLITCEIDDRAREHIERIDRCERVMINSLDVNDAMVAWMKRANHILDDIVVNDPSGDFD